MPHSIEHMEHPKADRVPRRQRVSHQIVTHTLTSDWVDLDLSVETTEIPVRSPEGRFVLPEAHNAYGDIIVRKRQVDTTFETTADIWNHFRVTIGVFPTYDFPIPIQVGFDPDFLGEYHPFFYSTLPPACEQEEESLEAVFPPWAIFRNVFIPPPPAEQIATLLIVVNWRGVRRINNEIDYGCDGTAEVQIELAYETSTTVIDPEALDEPLDLWGEDVSQNVVFLPTVPRRDHIEYNSQPRTIGFFQDRAVDTPIPGRHFIPKGFMELFSAHKTRMVDEEPVFTNAVTKIVRSAWTTLTADSEGVTQLRIEGIPVLPGTGNTRGTIIVRIAGVDVSDVQPTHYFFVRFGAEDTDDSYDIPAGRDFPEHDFYPFFLRHTTTRDCDVLEQALERAYPPKAIFDNVTGPEDGPWDLVMSLKWQGVGGFYGNCGSQRRMAQIELQYQVFEGPKTPTEVCKHSYASVVIGSDGFARGLFCSKHDPINVQRAQKNHWAHPFVNRGTADFSEPVDGQRDFSISQQVPPGMCALIGALHAPLWTEMLFYSERQICRRII